MKKLLIISLLLSSCTKVIVVKCSCEFQPGLHLDTAVTLGSRGFLNSQRWFTVNDGAITLLGGGDPLIPKTLPISVDTSLIHTGSTVTLSDTTK